jgi:exonuclease SbcD
MIKFIHTADVHFGMENYGKIDQKTGIHSRLLDFNKALNFCIDRGIEEKIDFFLFAGDAYKTANPSPTQQRLLMRSLLRLHEKNIPVIIIVGNHDNPLSFGKANALDIFGDMPLDGFYVVSKPMVINLATKNGPVQIVGIPWPTRNTIAMSQQHLHKSAREITEYISQSVTTIITNFAQQLDPAIPAILSSHLTVSSGIFSGSEKRAIYGNDPIFLPSQLAIPPFDYVALGHLHRHQNLNSNGYPAVVYSGSIERVDFGERKEDKGFCLVSIEKKGTTSYKFIKGPMRPFIQIEARLDAGDGQTEQLLEEIKKYDITDAVIKILYHLPAGKKDRIDLPTIQRECASAIHVVGILPIRAVETRERRASMKVDMDLSTLLTTYFEAKEEFKDRKDLLIQKALDLEVEACEHEHEER